MKLVRKNHFHKSSPGISMILRFQYLVALSAVITLSTQTTFAQMPSQYSRNAQQFLGSQQQVSNIANRGNAAANARRDQRPAGQGTPRAGLYQYQPGIVGMAPGKTGNAAWDRMSPNEKLVFTGGWGLQNPSGGVNSVADWGHDSRFGAGGQATGGVVRFNPTWSNQSAPINSVTPGAAHDGQFYGNFNQRAASMSPADTSWAHSPWRNQNGVSSYMSHDGAWTARPLR